MPWGFRMPRSEAQPLDLEAQVSLCLRPRGRGPAPRPAGSVWVGMGFLSPEKRASVTFPLKPYGGTRWVLSLSRVHTCSGWGLPTVSEQSESESFRGARSWAWRTGAFRGLGEVSVLWVSPEYMAEFLSPSHLGARGGVYLLEDTISLGMGVSRNLWFLVEFPKL